MGTETEPTSSRDFRLNPPYGNVKFGDVLGMAHAELFEATAEANLSDERGWYKEDLLTEEYRAIGQFVRKTTIEVNLGILDGKEN